jgi:hypothetical protein
VTHSYMCLIKTANFVGVLMTRPPKGEKSYIHGFRNEIEGIDYFERAYNAAHARGQCASTGAMLSWMQFRPSIIRLNINTIKAIMDKEMPCVRVSGEGQGPMILLKLDKVKGEKLWNLGIQPTLVAKGL